MADKTQGSIDINADPKAIMAVIEDYEAYPEWAGQVKKVEVRERDAATGRSRSTTRSRKDR